MSFHMFIFRVYIFLGEVCFMLFFSILMVFVSLWLRFKSSLYIPDRDAFSDQ